MTHYHLPRPLTAAALLTPLFISAGNAEADVNLLFPIFGVLNGMQIARLNAVPTSPDSEQTCPVKLAFIDSQGRMIGSSNDFELQGGMAGHTDFVGDPSMKPRTRLPLRAQVMYGNPEAFPGCRAGVLASVEIFDKATEATQFVLTNPVMWEPPGSVDFDIKFLPTGATTPIGCEVANVSIHFDVFDQAGALQSAVTRPCVPGERYRVTLDPGPYSIRAQGLQGLAVCYEKSEPLSIQPGQVQTLSIIANQHANGAQQGCTYPPPPRG
jgi:hypothetical protein